MHACFLGLYMRLNTVKESSRLKKLIVAQVQLEDMMIQYGYCDIYSLYNKYF